MNIKIDDMKYSILHSDSQVHAKIKQGNHLNLLEKFSKKFEVCWCPYIAFFSLV